MNATQARERLDGKHSLTNIVLQHPLETWRVRIAQADAASAEQAYWVLRAHHEGLLDEEEGT